MSQHDIEWQDMTFDKTRPKIWCCWMKLFKFSCGSMMIIMIMTRMMIMMMIVSQKFSYSELGKHYSVC